MDENKGTGVIYYPPHEEYKTFDNEDDYAERGRSWGLFGKAPKKEFWYKGQSFQNLVTIQGYQQYGHTNVLVVAFENGKLTCIHPSYLKEMQSSSFGKELVADNDEDAGTPIAEQEFVMADAPVKKEKTAEKKAPKKEKEKKIKLELPLDKVKFTAKVKEFTTKPNPFSDTDDEVLLFEEVVVQIDPPIIIGDAWCGYSNTLKGIGLESGESLAFEAKVVDKKFNKEILYKINNPSKITKV
ncbi:hypothetical protein [Cohnella sp.]|uniref:hypothetical protein n=1 Tax=Cohnella sp. TaxID=1883426 RepID=UPI003562301F